MATANTNAAPGTTRPVDQHVEFVVKVIVVAGFPVSRPAINRMLELLSPTSVGDPTDFSASLRSQTILVPYGS